MTYTNPQIGQTVMHPLQNENLNVVLVDDDPIFREIIGAKISQHSNITIFHVGSGDELFDVLPRQPIDCVILDYDLGIDSGLAVKQRIDEFRGQHPPTLMLTGDGRESTVIRAFRMGIHDYLPKKGLRPEDVVKSVLRVVERDRKEALEKAEHAHLVAASAIDMLTGLEGRVRIDERLSRLASLPTAARSAYGLVLIELADYNKIAETVGLKAADQALRDFGQTLQRTLRSGDICGRYSGSAFLLIADVAGDSGLLQQICHRLADNLSHELRLGAARIDISAKVSGMVCSHAGSADTESIPPALVEIAKAAGFFVARETAIAPQGAPTVAPASQATSGPVAESRPAASDAAPSPGCRRA